MFLEQKNLKNLADKTYLISSYVNLLVLWLFLFYFTMNRKLNIIFYSFETATRLPPARRRDLSKSLLLSDGRPMGESSCWKLSESLFPCSKWTTPLGLNLNLLLLLLVHLTRFFLLSPKSYIFGQLRNRRTPMPLKKRIMMGMGKVQHRWPPQQSADKREYEQSRPCVN